MCKEESAAGEATPTIPSQRSASPETAGLDQSRRRLTAPAVPVEGLANTPLDPRRPRVHREWRAGDPPVDPGDLGVRDEVVYVRAPAGPATPPRRQGQAGPALADPEQSWPEPSHGPAFRQARIREGRERGAQVVGKVNWSNARYAGQTYLDALPEPVRKRFPHGVTFSYEGFPIFDRYAVKTVRLEAGFAPPKDNGRPDRYSDNKNANAVFGWRSDPPGLTWHHKEDGRTMVLVDSDLHALVRHWGGIRVSRTSIAHEE
ncbi:HNH endonuclease family protein [Flindersiella endophytica]